MIEVNRIVLCVELGFVKLSGISTSISYGICKAEPSIVIYRKSILIYVSVIRIL